VAQLQMVVLSERGPWPQPGPATPLPHGHNSINQRTQGRLCLTFTLVGYANIPLQDRI
ncbi:hypothetical protein C7212DRAFT_170138, partial [Tuber magnatum]